MYSNLNPIHVPKVCCFYITIKFHYKIYNLVVVCVVDLFMLVPGGDSNHDDDDD